MLIYRFHCTTVFDIPGI
uniref:Uncharacterized protein n=1 Tax=Anguilla anguilla TaxID=7936 RepID=A0A0E9RUP8_ANGAN